VNRRFTSVAVGLALVVSLGACGSSGNDAAPDITPPAAAEAISEGDGVFGPIEVHDVMNGAGTAVVGTRAEVTANRNQLTDETLVDFWQSNIRDSDHNSFTINFGDGTGYVFHGSGSLFTYGNLTEEGTLRGDEMSLAAGRVTFDANTPVGILIIPRVDVPDFNDLSELKAWAESHDVEVQFNDESFETIENPSDDMHIVKNPGWNYLYEGDIWQVTLSTDANSEPTSSASLAGLFGKSDDELSTLVWIIRTSLVSGQSVDGVMTELEGMGYTPFQASLLAFSQGYRAGLVSPGELAQLDDTVQNAVRQLAELQ